MKNDTFRRSGEILSAIDGHEMEGVGNEVIECNEGSSDIHNNFEQEASDLSCTLRRGVAGRVTDVSSTIPCADGTKKASEERRRGMTTYYVELIDEILRKDPKKVPRHVKCDMMNIAEHLNGSLPADFPSNSQIVNRIGIVKRRMKSRQFTT